MLWHVDSSKAVLSYTYINSAVDLAFLAATPLLQPFAAKETNTMKVGLQTWGTDGDILPFIALANGLQQAGHTVTLAYTSVDGKDYAERPELGEVTLITARNTLHVNHDPDPYSIRATPGSLREFTVLLDRFYEPHTEVMFAASDRLCKENDLVIGHGICYTLATAAELHKTKRISMLLYPMALRSKHVAPNGKNHGPTLNSFMWWIGDIISRKQWFNKARRMRSAFGLPAVRSLQRELFTSSPLTILATSERFVALPTDLEGHVALTGFLGLPATSKGHPLSTQLQAFLDAGPPPIFMTFGSCMSFDAEASTELLVKSAQLAGCRAIVQTPIKELDLGDGEMLHVVERIPHQVIFPSCSLIVHHGGAGTTQSALLAGKPSVVVAHAFDQPYWGGQLERAGVAGRTLYRRTATPSSLAAEISSAINKPALNSKASELGARMTQENGVERCVALVEAKFGS